MKKIILIFFSLIFVWICLSFEQNTDAKYVTHTVDPHTQNIVFSYKDNNNNRIGSLQQLKKNVENKGKKLLFAMNGGMFKEDFSPVGFYVEDGKLIEKVNIRKAEGNFYMKPNGIFYIDKSGDTKISTTDNFDNSIILRYATQSGPMLVINGGIHPDFNKESTNLNIRNGVGILPNGCAIFAMSKEKVNFYNFAKYFKDKGCENALYLDGFVSRTYAPSQKWVQLDGNFGVIIGVTN